MVHGKVQPEQLAGDHRYYWRTHISSVSVRRQWEWAAGLVGVGRAGMGCTKMDRVKSAVAVPMISYAPFLASTGPFGPLRFEPDKRLVQIQVDLLAQKRQQSPCW